MKAVNIAFILSMTAFVISLISMAVFVEGKPTGTEIIWLGFVAGTAIITHFIPKK
jgi:hypothetical protein